MCLNLKKLYVRNKFCLRKLVINLNPFPQLSVFSTERLASLSGLSSEEGQRDEEKGSLG